MNVWGFFLKLATRALLHMTLEVHSAREQHGCGQNSAHALHGTRVWASEVQAVRVGI